MTVKAKFGPSYSRPLTVEFTAADFGAGSVLIGKVPKALFIPECVVEVLDVFDGAAAITVGDLVGVARLQATKDNDPEVANKYATEPHYAYAVATNVYVFLTGSPTVGRGRVVVYLG